MIRIRVWKGEQLVDVEVEGYELPPVEGLPGARWVVHEVVTGWSPSGPVFADPPIWTVAEANLGASIRATYSPTCQEAEKRFREDLREKGIPAYHKAMTYTAEACGLEADLPMLLRQQAS